MGLEDAVISALQEQNDFLKLSVTSLCNPTMRTAVDVQVVKQQVAESDKKVKGAILKMKHARAHVLSVQQAARDGGPSDGGVEQPRIKKEKKHKRFTKVDPRKLIDLTSDTENESAVENDPITNNDEDDSDDGDVEMYDNADEEDVNVIVNYLSSQHCYHQPDLNWVKLARTHPHRSNKGWCNLYQSYKAEVKAKVQQVKQASQRGGRSSTKGYHKSKM